MPRNITEQDRTWKFWKFVVLRFIRCATPIRFKMLKVLSLHILRRKNLNNEDFWIQYHMVDKNRKSYNQANWSKIINFLKGRLFRYYNFKIWIYSLLQGPRDYRYSNYLRNLRNNKNNTIEGSNLIIREGKPKLLLMLKIQCL